MYNRAFLAVALVAVAMPVPSLCQEQTNPWQTRLYKSFPMSRTAKPKAKVDTRDSSEPIAAATSVPKAVARANDLKKAGDYSKAILVLTSATKAFPTSKELYLELGNCLIHERRLSDALLNANAAIGKCAPTAAMFRQRASANYMLHDYENTLKDLDQACKMSPPTAEDYFTKANCFSNAGNSKAVIENVGLGLKQDPKNGEAYYLRAKTYKNLNQNALAEADFAKAMSLQK
jgi:tetratricopeptide (TPR) repeat protein